VQHAEPDQPEHHGRQRRPYGHEQRAPGREREQGYQGDTTGYGNRYRRHVLLRYLVALGLTLAVEVPLYTLWLWSAVEVPAARAARLAVAVNLVTHPPLWWSLAVWSPGSAYPLALAGAELVACLVEWALLRWRLGRDGGVLALVVLGVNAASLAAGLLVNA
jgi:hypothetical protein